MDIDIVCTNKTNTQNLDISIFLGLTKMEIHSISNINGNARLDILY